MAAQQLQQGLCFLYLGGVQDGYGHAWAWVCCQQALMAQQLHGFAHGCAADSQAAGNLSIQQFRAGKPFALQDALAQAIGNGRAQGLGLEGQAGSDSRTGRRCTRHFHR